MKQNRLSRFLYGLNITIRKHSPEIFTGIGVGSMITAIVTAIQATPKAMILLEEKKKKIDSNNLKVIDIIKTTWKCYIPTIIAAGLSITCHIGASAVNMKRNAALATAYSISESALKLYQDKVIETIGEKEEQKVRDVIAKEHVDRKPVTSTEIIVTEKGNTLCLDPISQRYFKSDVETLNRAINEVNRRMLSSMSVSLNDFYDEIGLNSTSIGDSLGWNVDWGLIKISFSSQLASNDIPCLVINFLDMPKYGYDK